MKSKEQSSFDRFTGDPVRKKLFEEKYEAFLLSEFIIEEMEKRNISVRQLAKETGLSTSIIQGLRSGDKKNITLKNVAKISRYLGYDIVLKKGKKTVPIA